MSSCVNSGLSVWVSSIMKGFQNICNIRVVQKLHHFPVGLFDLPPNRKHMSTNAVCSREGGLLMERSSGKSAYPLFQEFPRYLMSSITACSSVSIALRIGVTLA